jgi:ankyrin repeat protein
VQYGYPSTATASTAYDALTNRHLIYLSLAPIVSTMLFLRFFLAVGLVVSAAAANEEVDKHQSLRNAAASGNVNDVRHWLKQGANVNSVSPGGWASLVYAADRAHPEVVDVLLQAGADPNLCERDGWSPLMFAAVKGDIETCRIIIRAGGDLQHVSKNEWTPLKAAQRSKNPDAGAFMEGEIAKSKERNVDNVGLGREFLQAVKDSEVQRVREFLERGMDPNTISPNGWTGVTYASANGNVEMMKTLIVHGTDVNKADKDGWTPIMFAAFQGNLEAVQLLLDHSADVLVKNIANTGALTMAANYATHKNDDRVKRAIASAGMAQALRREDLNWAIEMVEIGGADVNFQDQKSTSGKWTPLILATAKHNREAVNWLLSQGADPNIAEKDGWMPIFFAVFSNDVQLCKLILDAGSDIQYRLANGKSALDLARERKNADVIKVMTDHEEKERRALEESKTADPKKEVLPNAVETRPSEEEKRQEQMQREAQQHLEEARRKRQAQMQKEQDIEEDIRYEDVGVAEPEGLFDKVMSFFGF